MSNTKLKTVGDCVKLCNSAGIKISHLDDNLFETAGVVEGLLDKITQLEQEVKELKALQERYVWITRDELKQYSDVNQALLGKTLAQHDKEVIRGVKNAILNHELTKYGGSLSDALYVIDEQLQEQGDE